MRLPRGMWACSKCGTVGVAPDLGICPHCQEERDMPKVSDDGLATNLIDPATGEMDGARFPGNAREGIENEKPAEEARAVEPEPAAEPAAQADAAAGDVRAWAKEHGLAVSGKGKLPQWVLDAYAERLPDGSPAGEG